MSPLSGGWANLVCASIHAWPRSWHRGPPSHLCCLPGTILLSSSGAHSEINTATHCCSPTFSFDSTSARNYAVDRRGQLRAKAPSSAGSRNFRRLGSFRRSKLAASPFLVPPLQRTERPCCIRRWSDQAAHNGCTGWQSPQPQSSRHAVRVLIGALQCEQGSCRETGTPVKRPQSS